MVLAEAGQRQNIFIESSRLEKTSRIIVSDFDQSPPCLPDHGTSFLEHLQGWWLSLGEPEDFAHRNRVKPILPMMGIVESFLPALFLTHEPYVMYSLPRYANYALRDNRIELVRASWHELSISVSDVSLSDEGQYTCSLFTMPVKTSKAFLTVLGVPEKPQITGFTSPVMEGERMQLTCKTSGSKPAADIRWFKNDKEVKGVFCPPPEVSKQRHVHITYKQNVAYTDVKYLKEEDAVRKTFTVSSTLDFLADRSDDGAVVSCRVDHESLNSTPQIAMQVLEIHYTPLVKIISSNSWPEEGQSIILTCESKGKPVPEPVLWTKDGGELPDPERMVVNGRVLSISFLNKTDNGTYRCEAKNPIGRNSTEYVLIVHDVFNTLLPTTVIPSPTTATVTTNVALKASTTTSAAATSIRGLNHAIAGQCALAHAQKGDEIGDVLLHPSSESFSQEEFASIGAPSQKRTKPLSVILSSQLEKDPNALAGQTGPDHALIGGIVAVVVFVTLCSIILLGRYLARHKGTYLTNEAKGAEDAPDADTAIINAEGSQVNAEEKKEYFI
ncbi:hypothetical protein TURU_056354 [Turdus rufiventris]|nr:hypothetical protein TURU_056354 [Turdus rufiventris]